MGISSPRKSHSVRSKYSSKINQNGGVKKNLPTTIEKRPLLYHILTIQAPNFYYGFCNVLGISAKNTDAKSTLSCCFLIEECDMFKLRLEAVIKRVSTIFTFILQFLECNKSMLSKIKVRHSRLAKW